MMKLSDIATLFNSEEVIADAEITGVSTDSRTIEQGNLFVALHGENFDGHDYLNVVEEKGAIAVIVDRDVSLSIPVIKVKDTLIALGDMAAWWRQQLQIQVVGLTGSNGKTTVKDMLTSILSEVGNVTSTRGNFNNDIGLPLTMLQIKPEHEYAVIEMGANHAGEIAYLTRITQPDVAILNNAGAAHLEGFGSLQGVAEAKGEIFSGLSENGVAIINIDDRFADYWMSLCDDHKKIFFGLGAAADVTTTTVVENYTGCFVLNAADDEVEVCLNVLGVHNQKNALAASAAAIALGVDVVNIKKGLEKFTGVKGRLQLFRAANDSIVIDDSYNANPTSMRVAIDVLSQQQKTSVLVIGDMGELGSDAAELHAEIGEYAKEKNINILMTLGELSRNAAERFGENGIAYDEKQALVRDVSKKLEQGVAVLVKGSRSMHMEEVVDALVNKNNTGIA